MEAIVLHSPASLVGQALAFAKATTMGNGLWIKFCCLHLNYKKTVVVHFSYVFVFKHRLFTL